MEKIINIEQQIIKGFEFLNNNNNIEALAIAQKILIKRYNINALILAGLSAFKLEKYTESEDYLKKAYNEKPLDQALQGHLLEVLLIQEKLDEGLSLINKLKKVTNDIKWLKIQYLEKKGDYKTVIKIATTVETSIRKFEILAWNYELLNQEKQAKINTKKGLLINESNFKCNIVKAKLSLRKKKYTKAKKVIKNIESSKLGAVNLSIYYSIKAQIFEKQKKYKKAFNTYTKSNHALKQSRAYLQLSGSSYYTHEKIKTIKNYFNRKPIFNNMVTCEDKIVFMLGFPRSGTTLLEKILNSHTDIETIEEKPATDDVLQYFLSTKDSINKLETIDEHQIIQLQNHYIAKRNQYSKSQNRIIIDKMPLNIIHIGILYRIFPNAKFIISTRDIRDVALSCYFQSFAINDAMANFLDWQDTQNYLKSVMELGLKTISKYPIQHEIVNYETLVKTPFKVVKDLLGFLNLPWQEDMKKYRTTLHGKSINTPSYEKVTQKINTQQLNKWHNFKFLFK